MRNLEYHYYYLHVYQIMLFFCNDLKENVKVQVNGPFTYERGEQTGVPAESPDNQSVWHSYYRWKSTA